MGRLYSYALATAAVLAASQAQARPRDEVMIGAYRCAGIAATRQWLDCYYGAAEPQRALLGLASVPKAQAQLSQSPPSGGTPQDQPIRDEVIAAAGRCTSSENERQWLDCYYAAALPARSLLGLATAQQASAIQPAGPRKAPASRYRAGPIANMLGASNLFIESPMTSYSFDAQQRFTVTLANGQSWQQTGPERQAHWAKPATSYVVNVTGGAFGSYNLAVKGESAIYKVKRLP